MKIKNKVVLVGDYTWEEMRDLLIVELRECDTFEKFVKIAGALASSIGTAKEIERVRKRLGIKQLNKEDLKKLK